MAFFGKVGNLLKHSLSKNINSELSASNPSIFQAIRCMSSSKLFIGGLSYSTDDTSLREAFAAHGEVVEARVIMDRETGRSRGFGFVTFVSGDEANSAIQALDGRDLHGRTVRVNYATERAPRFGGGGGYGGGGYGGGAGGYGGGGYGGGGGAYGGGGYGGGGSGSGGYGGDSYGSGGSGGGYSGGSGGYGGYGGNSGNIAGGGGGSDNYVSPAAGGDNSFANSGYTGSAGGAAYGNSSQFNNNDIGGPLEGNFKDDDDDEPDDLADKRA